MVKGALLLCEAVFFILCLSVTCAGLPVNPCYCSPEDSRGFYACFNFNRDTSDVNCEPRGLCAKSDAAPGEFSIQAGGPIFLCGTDKGGRLSPAGQQALSSFVDALQRGSSFAFSSIKFNASSCSKSQAARSAGPGETDSKGTRERSSGFEALSQRLSASISSALKSALTDTKILDLLTQVDQGRRSEAFKIFQNPARKAAAGTVSEQGNGADVGAGDEPSEALDQNDRLMQRAVPGITAIVYEEFFDRASAVAVMLLKENFRKVKLDSVDAVAHVPVLGDFNIKLEDLQLSGLRLDDTTTGVSLGDQGSFDLRVHGLDAVVDSHFQWRRTKFPFISGGCQAQVTARNGNVKLTVKVEGDESGRPKVTDISAAELSFDSISIKTSQAKLSWLYNAVAAFAHTQIQDAITNAVGAQVTTTVPDQVNQLLQGVPTIVTIKGLDLNTSLAKNPEVTTDRLVVWDWGRFQNPNHQLQECPFVRTVGLGSDGPVLPGGSPYMLVADIDESIVNCLTWDMYKNGRLHAFLQGDDLPEQALYTDSWRFVIPAVYSRCPSCPMAVNATVTSAPVTHIDAKDGIVTSGTASLSFFLADKSEGHSSKAQVRRSLASDEYEGSDVQLGEHLFTLSLAGQLSVSGLSLDEDTAANGWRLNLSMKVNQTALDVGVLESDVGHINQAALHFALTVASFLVEDKVNHGILKDGFLLPDIPHVKVDRANVTVVDAAMALGGDFSYVS